MATRVTRKPAQSSLLGKLGDPLEFCVASSVEIGDEDDENNKCLDLMLLWFMNIGDFS